MLSLIANNSAKILLFRNGFTGGQADRRTGGRTRWAPEEPDIGSWWMVPLVFRAVGTGLFDHEPFYLVFQVLGEEFF